MDHVHNFNNSINERRLNMNKLNTFQSPRDFIKRFINLFRGTTFISTYKMTDRKFSEQISLTVAMQNNCYDWTSFHSALGKRHGLSNTDIENLLTISKKDFTYKEWVALKYVHEWTILRGNEPKGEFVKDFETLYSKKEQARVRKLMHTMLFSTYLMNYFKDRPWKKESEPEEFIINKELERLL